MSPQVVALHNAIQQFKILGCWYMAEVLSIELIQLIKIEQQCSDKKGNVC